MLKTELKIRVSGAPCLRVKSKPVTAVGPDRRMLITRMIDVMHAEQGIGLAAPQVGINERIIVADIGEGPFAMVNPTVIKKSGSDVMEEGCLSVPGVTVNVKRAQRITVRYMDENNNPMEREYIDLTARVILHEIDHLDGKLIIDYAGWRQKWKFRHQLAALRQQANAIPETAG